MRTVPTFTRSATPSTGPIRPGAALLCSGLLLIACQPTAPTAHGLPSPLDPQIVQDQDDMTWDDYRPIPGIDWADRSLTPEREFRIALIAIDFEDQPFVITLPRGSDPFGNPQIDPITRDEVPQFYADFFLEPSQLNHGQTINGYWMEQSRGRFGITAVDAYGPYRMPEPLWEYGLNEYGQNDQTPDGIPASSRMEPHVDSMWAAEHGDIADDYDAILRIYAGYDETTVWQEFGEMKFDTPDDIPPEWGNPNPAMPRWVPTRYVEWTSWRAGAQQWGLSSMRQGESSGTITHELGHFAFRIPDLNNNPYVEPYRRVAAGPWDMMDRGSFNGPGGPHRRWVVPPIQGAAMPAGLMVRNRLNNEFIEESEVLELSRDGLGVTGPVAARITARAVDPLPGTFAGVTVRLDGEEPRDRTPTDTTGVDPLSPGIANYDFFSLEVVQRIGYDSFTPDQGVLLAKNKDSLRGRNGGPNGFNSFIWVIDAHPVDIDMVDYVKPNGEPVMRTIADYRQLNDALFHAGVDSGSEYEWVDEDNDLHFYVIRRQENESGIVSYEVAVRSTSAAGSQPRGVLIESTGAQPAAGVAAAVDPGATPTTVWFTVTNIGSADPATESPHPSDPSTWEAVDVVRLELSVEGAGWQGALRSAVVALGPGESKAVPVYASAGSGADPTATLNLTATSESDPAARADASVDVSGRASPGG